MSEFIRERLQRDKPDRFHSHFAHHKLPDGQWIRLINLSRGPVRFTGLYLIQLHQHARGAFRVNESIFLSVGSGAGLLVDQADIFRPEL
jgi:hypothetical protein